MRVNFTAAQTECTVAHTASDHHSLDEEFLSGLVDLHVLRCVSVQELSTFSLTEIIVQAELDWDTRLPATKKTSTWDEISTYLSHECKLLQ